MKLTEQQERGIRMIANFLDDEQGQVFILKGYAGTGKTTLIKQIINQLSDRAVEVNLMAPTGRAAKVLRTKLDNYCVTTIHRGIYEFSCLKINESKGELRYIYPLRDNKERGIYIIDEASMISSKESHHELFQFGSGVLINDLLSFVKVDKGSKLIFVGDPMQLPPVGDNRSAALDESYFKDLGLNTSSYELTDIVRQDKSSKILINAMMLRALITKQERNQLVFERNDNEVVDICAIQIADSYCEHEDGSSAIVCFSNQQAADYNSAIRKIKFPDATHVNVGDRLMVVSNNYAGEEELFNGDIITVLQVDEQTKTLSAPIWKVVEGVKKQLSVALNFRKITLQSESGKIQDRYIIDTLLENKQPSLTVDEMKALYINFAMRMRDAGYTDTKSEAFIKAMSLDPYYHALQVKYGYAFTCHKSQGGEWKNVYVDFAKRTGLDTDSLRWKYTAVTRSSQKLHLTNLPDITSMTGLKVNPINRTAKPLSNALSFDQVKETPYHSSSLTLSEKSKYWSIVNNMDGTLYSVKNVICKPWRNIYEVDSPNGTVRVDAIFNGAGLFTKYEIPIADDELLGFFRNEDNISYRIDYQASLGSLKELHNRMISICDECGITLTNVTSGSYQVVYHMKTAANFASITFFYNGKGFITYAAPLSELGESDEKLSALIEKLK